MGSDFGRCPPDAPHRHDAAYLVDKSSDDEGPESWLWTFGPALVLPYTVIGDRKESIAVVVGSQHDGYFAATADEGVLDRIGHALAQVTSQAWPKASGCAAPQTTR